MQEFPVGQEFRLMNFRPRLDEALLRPREPATNALDRIESERGQNVLIQGVEVRSMVRGTDLHEHPNDHSEKARQFRHGDTLHRPSGFRRANVRRQPRRLIIAPAAVGCTPRLAGLRIIDNR